MRRRAGRRAEAHGQILAATQRDAETVKCPRCGGNGRVVMRTFGCGSYEMGWACLACDPSEERYWTGVLDRRRRADRRARVASAGAWLRRLFQ